MAEMGKAMMGTGESEGDDRAKMAAESAISNPLLDEVSMNGARGVLINITGGDDMTLLEVDSAANRIREEVDSDANIIFGATMDSALEGRIRVSIVATGIDSIAGQQPLPIEPFTTIVGGRPKAAASAPAPQVAAVLLEAEEARATEAQAAEAKVAAEAVAVAQAEAEATAQAAAIEEVVAAEPEMQVEEKPARRIEAEKTAAWTFPSMLNRNSAPAAEDAYIPTAPSVPTSSTTTPAPAPAMVTPAEVEAIAPTAAEPQRQRRSFTSLFDRMTGKADEQAETAPAAEAAPATEKAEPSLEAKAPKTDDYLDIPTFLRRQAN
jgi:cell division protein FtsZ